MFSNYHSESEGKGEGERGRERERVRESERVRGVIVQAVSHGEWGTAGRVHSMIAGFRLCHGKLESADVRRVFFSLFCKFCNVLACILGKYASALSSPPLPLPLLFSVLHDLCFLNLDSHWWHYRQPENSCTRCQVSGYRSLSNCFHGFKLLALFLSSFPLTPETFRSLSISLHPVD